MVDYRQEGLSQSTKGGWISWPVLWLGPVPVATSPIWYVPMGERRKWSFSARSWRNDENYQLTVPVYFTLGTSADLKSPRVLEMGQPPFKPLE